MPAAAPNSNCSAMPIWKYRCGNSLAKMCMSVYLPRSAVRPDDPVVGLRRGRPGRARTAPGWCAGPGRRTTRSSPRCVVVLRFSCLPISCVAGGQLVAAELPFVGVDAHEVRFLSVFQQRHAAPDPGVAQEDRRLPGAERRPAMSSKAASSASTSLPSTRRTNQPQAAHLSAIGSMRSTPAVGPSACRALMSTSAVRLSEPVMAGAHRGFPGRALVQLAVGEEVDHPRREPWWRRPSAMPTATVRPWPSEPPEISMPGCVAGHSRHRQPGAVGSVAVELVYGNDAGFGQRGVQPDGVVPGREQEPVPAVPVRIVGPVAQLVGVDGGQHVGGAQRLPDVTLALGLAHVEDVVPHSVRGRRHLLAAVGLHGGVIEISLLGVLLACWTAGARRRRPARPAGARAAPRSRG